ncbi:hypothetical protein I302_106776 [Kwoniella bestiolae CBS 10118]|uniref:Uncharacterized protein n=1 Tax=Kwoniella bestiolae CBS 10118 TaxID=1296100 RepID=A0A1B9G0F2_9TREE|nr:hypothetical protein I302_05958 [Kwoniella bestiolae CBS 10118]OCF24498.1 hypothetical protein I302_05958 [Kwoniella bestiolae CBS 10118]
MTPYNPIISTSSFNSSIISFTNPTGSSGWISRKDGRWSIKDCSGFSISSSSDGNIHIYIDDGNSSTHRFIAGKDYRNRSNGTFRFSHPDEDNLAWIEVRRNGLMRYQDSRGNFTVIYPSGGVRFVDIYVARETSNTEVSSDGESGDEWGSESIFMPWLNLGVFIPSRRSSEEGQAVVKDNRQSGPWVLGKIKNIFALPKSLSIALKK